MRQFEPYPIYINHPGRWEGARSRQRDHFVDRGDYKMMTWLDSTGKRLYEIAEDKTPGPESRKYESQVHSLLTLIASTDVGRLLFGSLNRKVKYWIVPLDYLDRADCDCGAYVDTADPKEGGGVRIRFNPTDFNSPAKRWWSADDVLFHELIHAYREGRVGFANQNFKRMFEYDKAEEFFALHMQNTYLASRGSLRFYRSYRRLEPLSKSAMYQYFATDGLVLMAFRHYLDHDPLAAALARWMHPADSFNPWRDQPVLERIFLSGTSGIGRLPPF
jgi:hypothetical protein